MSGPVPSPSMNATMGWSGTTSLPCLSVTLSPAGTFTFPGICALPLAESFGSSRRLFDGVERRTGLEPSELLLGETVARPNRLRGPAGPRDDDRDGCPRRQAPEAGDAHPVGLAEAVVVGGIRKRQRQDPLLLQVRLVDAREAPRDHRPAAEVPRRHRRVLAARALAVVLVADHHPADAPRLVVTGDLGERHAPLARQQVESLARLAGERVDGAEEHVVADAVEMAAVQEPAARGRDVVGRRLAFGLDQDRQAEKVLAVPGGKLLEDLQTLAPGRDLDL